jgi:hypothetical protein
MYKLRRCKIRSLQSLRNAKAFAGSPPGVVQRLEAMAAVASRRHTVCTLRKEPVMAASHFQQFLDDATCPAPDTDSPLGPDCLYGLYTSWCLLHGMTPKSGARFRAGMRLCRVNIRSGKLRMKGRAAADYILTSYPYSG